MAHPLHLYSVPTLYSGCQIRELFLLHPVLLMLQLSYINLLSATSHLVYMFVKSFLSEDVDVAVLMRHGGDGVVSNVGRSLQVQR